MRKWLDDLIRILRHGDEWAEAIARAARNLAKVRAELDAIKSAMRSLLKRIQDAEERLRNLQDDLREAVLAVERARINELGPDVIARLQAQVDDIERLKRLLEQSIARMNARLRGLEQAQEEAAVRAEQAARQLDSAEMKSGNPGDY